MWWRRHKLSSCLIPQQLADSGSGATERTTTTKPANRQTCMWSPANITRVVSDAKFNASRHSHSVAWAASSIRMWVKKPVHSHTHHHCLKFTSAYWIAETMNLQKTQLTKTSFWYWMLASDRTTLPSGVWWWTKKGWGKPVGDLSWFRSVHWVPVTA